MQQKTTFFLRDRIKKQKLNHESNFWLFTCGLNSESCPQKCAKILFKTFFAKIAQTFESHLFSKR